LLSPTYSAFDRGYQGFAGASQPAAYPSLESLEAKKLPLPPLIAPKPRKVTTTKSTSPLPPPRTIFAEGTTPFAKPDPSTPVLMPTSNMLGQSAAIAGNLTSERRWAGVPSGKIGLKNLGNTCYMNSILQCMSGTAPFARYYMGNRSHLALRDFTDFWQSFRW